MTIRRMHYGFQIGRADWDAMTDAAKTDWLSAQYAGFARRLAEEILDQQLAHVSISLDRDRMIQISCDAQVRIEGNHRWLTAGEVDERGPTFRSDPLGRYSRSLPAYAGDDSPSEPDAGRVSPPVAAPGPTSPSGVRGVLPAAAVIDDLGPPSRSITSAEIDALTAAVYRTNGTVRTLSTPMFRNDAYATFAADVAMPIANVAPTPGTPSGETEPSGALSGCACSTCQAQRRSYAERE